MDEAGARAAIEAIEVRAETTRTTLDGCSMVWRRWAGPAHSQRPPLVLLHGGSGSWRHWIRTIPEFARDRDVLAPDMPGFGVSDVPPEPIGFASVARVVAAGLEEVMPAGQRFDMAGFSFGSHTLQYVADALGDRVLTGVLVTAHMLGPMRAQPGQILSRWRDVTDPAERERILKRNLGALMLAHETSMDAMALHIYASDVPRARIRPAHFINDRDYAMIGRLKCRIGGIAGALDPLGVPSAAAEGEALLKARPDARFRLIENAGHWVPYEAPEAFNEALRELLDS